MMKIKSSIILFLAISISVIACDDEPHQIVDQDLLNVTWRADFIQTPDSLFIAKSDEEMTVQFSEEMTLGILAACNDCGGVYELRQDRSIAIDIQSCTEKFCGGRLSLLESIFLNALDNVTTYEVSDDRLLVFNIDGDYLIYFNAE